MDAVDFFYIITEIFLASIFLRSTIRFLELVILSASKSRVVSGTIMLVAFAGTKIDVVLPGTRVTLPLLVVSCTDLVVYA